MSLKYEPASELAAPKARTIGTCTLVCVLVDVTVITSRRLSYTGLHSQNDSLVNSGQE